MSATSGNDRSASSCPSWCTEHIGSLHQRPLGASTGQLQVVLEQQDDDGAPGKPQLSFRFCADGVLIDDSTEFPLEQILAALNGNPNS